MSARAFVVAASLLAASARAGELDYNVGGGLRSFPWGAAIAGKIGWNEALWGVPPAMDPNAALPSPWYGYLRPTLRLQTSGVVAAAEAAGEVFPVAILGFSIGHSSTHRNTTLATLDCGALACDGWLSRTRLSAHGTGGYGAAFVLSDVSVEWLRPSVKDRDFGDEASALAGQMGGDTLVRGEIKIGQRFGDRWSAGLSLVASAMQKQKSDNAEAGVFVNYAPAPWSFGVLAGTYRSSTARPGFTVGAGVSWTPRRSYGLR